MDLEAFVLQLGMVRGRILCWSCTWQVCSQEISLDCEKCTYNATLVFGTHSHTRLIEIGFGLWVNYTFYSEMKYKKTGLSIYIYIYIKHMLKIFSDHWKAIIWGLNWKSYLTVWGLPSGMVFSYCADENAKGGLS
jgi:hypothetical protein